MSDVISPVTAADPAGWDQFDVGWYGLGDLLGLGGRARHLLGADAVGLGLAILCADIKARDIAKAEMLLWRRRGARGWSMVEANQHPIARLLMTRPNAWHSWTQFWRMTIMHLELVQNAYIYIDLALDGTVRGLIPILPARCRPRVSPVTGNLFYEVFTGTEFERAQLGATYAILPASRMIHLRGRLWDGMSGLSSLALGSPIFDLVNAVNDYQTGIFGNDGRQPLVFETDQTFPAGEQGDAAFRRLKAQLDQATTQASLTGKPILLEAGLKAKLIALNAKDAATTETFNQQVMRICGLMNMPPHKIYALEAVAYNNMAAMNRQYYTDCLQPTAENIEESLKLALFVESDWPVFGPQFDQVKLMATDTESLKGLVDMAMKNGLMTFDEAREVLPFRLNPVANGDHRMVPVNYALLDADGNLVANAASGQPANQPGPTTPGDEGEDGSGGKVVRLFQN